jgi:hypothetical protein
MIFSWFVAETAEISGATNQCEDVSARDGTSACP